MSTESPQSKPEAIVFVVDDDLSVREGLERLLHAAGWEVETSASAQEFWDHRKENIPSCLVLDVQLPGLSGLDLQKRLQRRTEKFPSFFITGHGDIPTSVRAMKTGAVEFLVKPFSDQDLWMRFGKR
jgi:FixJ family two-component response regulator